MATNKIISFLQEGIKIFNIENNQPGKIGRAKIGTVIYFILHIHVKRLPTSLFRNFISNDNLLFFPA